MFVLLSQEECLGAALDCLVSQLNIAEEECDDKDKDQIDLVADDLLGLMEVSLLFYICWTTGGHLLIYIKKDLLMSFT